MSERELELQIEKLKLEKDLSKERHEYKMQQLEKKKEIEKIKQDRYIHRN
jgi:hypothetical protein